MPGLWAEGMIKHSGNIFASSEVTKEDVVIKKDSVKERVEEMKSPTLKVWKAREVKELSEEEVREATTNIVKDRGSVFGERIVANKKKTSLGVVKKLPCTPPPVFDPKMAMLKAIKERQGSSSSSSPEASPKAAPKVDKHAALMSMLSKRAPPPLTTSSPAASQPTSVGSKMDLASVSSNLKFPTTTSTLVVLPNVILSVSAEATIKMSQPISDIKSLTLIDDATVALLTMKDESKER